MKVGTTDKGNIIVLINNDTYLSFGKEKDVKWIYLSYLLEKGGTRSGECFKPDMSGLSAEAKKIIGASNMKVLKSVLKEFIKEDGVLDTKDLIKIGTKLELKGL